MQDWHPYPPDDLYWFDGVAANNSVLDETGWLSKWSAHTALSPVLPRVPPQACRIITPLIASAWRNLLISHPRRDLVHFFLKGISQGFRIGLTIQIQTLGPQKRTCNQPMSTQR